MINRDRFESELAASTGWQALTEKASMSEGQSKRGPGRPPVLTDGKSTGVILDAQSRAAIEALKREGENASDVIRRALVEAKRRKDEMTIKISKSQFTWTRENIAEPGSGKMQMSHPYGNAEIALPNGNFLGVAAEQDNFGRITITEVAEHTPPTKRDGEEGNQIVNYRDLDSVAIVD